MKKVWLLAFMFVLTISLVGCSAGSNQAANSDKTPATTSNGDSGKKSEEKVKLSLWHNFTGNDLRATMMRDQIDKFQQEHPNIELDIQAIPPDGYKTRLKTVAAANEMPDVFMMWPGAMTKEFHDGNLIQPINALLDSKPEWRDGYMPGSFDSFTIDGNIYSATLGLTPTSILFYNKAILDQYKLEVPKTWDDLLNAVKVIKEGGLTPIALGNKAAWLAQSSIISSLADRVTGTDWFLKAAAQDGAKFTDPEFVQALTYLQDLWKAGAFQEGFNSIDNTQMEVMFAQGQAAMMIDGGWALSNLAANATPEQLEDMGATVLPSIPGGKGNPNSLAGALGSAFGLSSKVEGNRLQAAYDLIYALSGPEVQKMTLDSSNLVSYKAELDESKVSPIFSEVYKLVNSVERTPVYDGVMTSAGSDAVNNGLQELLMGGDPQKIAQKIQDAQATSLQ
ncbi:extracellular solute-binding protein [Paenibacillus aceti]|uniref:Sugar-binding protein n=1 Tax=Paenibacillus aceti TaxID=1820010 RepID=A0ABQ1W8V6_9BACL|nr:extracellular solute-binding protein [Paenibacillus aceti]GGG19742.1 sugar-binding protein [Paenibacillus aceti]